MRKLRNIFGLLGLLVLASTPAAAQVSSGKVTTAAPSYTNNTAQPLSLDTSGNLRVVTSGSSGGVTDVNIDEVAGVAAGATVAGALDVTCVSGCVAGSGVSQGTATAAAPTYIEGSNNALSLTLGGAQRVSLTTAIPAGANVIGAVTQSGTWNIGTVTAVTGITNALPAGNNNIGDVDAIQSGTWTVQPGNTANTTPWLVTPIPATTTADTLQHSVVLANTTNATNVKNGAGTLYNVSVTNNTATIAYLKLYNSASAPTCGSGTPVARYIIPASTAGAGNNINLEMGAEYTTGISYCVTTGIGDSDTTAVAASAYIVNLIYK